MADVRLIDVNAAIKDLREQIVAFFGEAKKKVKPEDYYITKLSAYHEDLERLQIDNFIAYLNSRPIINPEDCRPQGRWELRAHEETCDYRWNVTAKCSECHHSKGEIYAGFFPGVPKSTVISVILDCAESVKLDNYCPNCGAKMDGEENNNASKNPSK